MKKWRNDRNYRRIKNADGTVSNIITVDGQNVQVADEIYKAYAKMDRQERYQEELQQRILHVSLEKLCEADVPIDIYMAEHSPSAEDIVIAAENDTEQQALIEQLPQVLSQLAEEERALIQAIYFDSRSERDLSREYGISQPAIHKRRDRVLKKLKNFYDFSDLAGYHPPVFSGME